MDEQAASLRLFDECARVDPSPALHGESSFEFMNRVDQPFWGRVRDQLDIWFRNYPDDNGDLRSRFRNRDEGQHFGAWWELYLYTLYERLGYAVTLHPSVEGTTKRPDFLLARGGEQFYVEAKTVFSGLSGGDAAGPHDGWVYDLVNRIASPNFWLSLEYRRRGKTQPKAAAITKPLEEWLSSLDPDQFSSGASLSEREPACVLTPKDDWELKFTAHPRRLEDRKKGYRTLGMYPAMTGLVNDEEMIKKALRKKSDRYGQLDKPYVIALMCTSPFVDTETLDQALFGVMTYQYYEAHPNMSRSVEQRDGFWIRKNEPKKSLVSAVLVGAPLMPWNIANRLPQLWINPWADRPIATTSPFSFISVENSKLKTTETSIEPCTIFEISQEWPGPEKPFSKTTRVNKMPK